MQTHKTQNTRQFNFKAAPLSLSTFSLKNDFFSYRDFIYYLQFKAKIILIILSILLSNLHNFH